MTSVVPANPYKPNRLKIVSVGINVENDTNDNLQLLDTEAVIAAERRVVTGGRETRTYGLIVDKQGIGVNMGLADRRDNSGNYAVQVDGSVLVKDTIATSNLIVYGTTINAGNSSLSNTTSGGFWMMGPRETNNIYYTGNITLGNSASTRYNAYNLNIVQSADRDIDHAQVSIQNLMASQLRMGILGTSNISPVVFNTRPGVPIEFHASRNQDHFTETYKQYYYDNGVLCNVVSEIPYYKGTSDAPHLVIDALGNIGIRTSETPRFQFNVRQRNPETAELQMIEVPKDEHMQLSVHGNAYTSNLLIWDDQTQSAQHIDSLYIRRIGVTMLANQIYPGEFAYGRYIFPNGIDVRGDVSVTGSQDITENLVVHSNTTLNHLYATDAILFDVASFCNDVYLQRDMIVKEALRLRGGLFAETLDANGQQVWCNVQFTLANNTFSNINYYGAGFTTPGRVGIGIRPVDEVNNQFVVKKQNPDIYEMELSHMNNSLIKSAYIGHPRVDARLSSEVYQDASLVFATPDSHDPDYNLYGFGQAPQNFYFYPGSYTTRVAEPIVSEDNPPVLNVHNEKRVGINVLHPQYELDVGGSIRFTSNIYIGDAKVGVWRERTFPIGGSGTFTALEYNRPGLCSNVAVNTLPDPAFGMVVGGGLKSMHGFWTDCNERMGRWVDSETSTNTTAPAVATSMFTLSKVGVGVKDATATLELQDKYSESTTIRLYTSEKVGDYDPSSSIEFAGSDKSWIIMNNDALSKRTLEFGYGSNTFLSDDTRRAMWMARRPSGQHQVVIGGNMYIADSNINPDKEAALVVDGGVSVIGNVNITGQYIINGTTLQNNNVVETVPTLPTQLGTDDVYIAGNNVYMNPTNMLAVGYDLARDQRERSDKTIFRVYQRDPTIPVIARFTCEGDAGFLEVANTRGQNVRIGFSGTPGFSIMNGENVPYMSFLTDTATGDNKLAINALQPITANLHVQTRGVGSNMIRMTRYYTGTNTGRNAPELEFENRIENNDGVRLFDKWVIRGPDTTYNQKLSFLYGYQDPGVAEDKQELVTFTNNGCIGIGNTQPEYALDVITSTDRGALRLLNTSSDGAPQIILQAGSTEYGADDVNDYRIYSQSNTFTVDSVNTNTYKKLLHFNAQHKLGILGEADQRFDVNVNGNINVADTIYINGNPVFGTNNDLSTDGFNIAATNIFVRPKLQYYGGLFVNRELPSSNLFHVNAGNNPNVLVLDAPSYTNCQLHFRSLAGDVFESAAPTYNVYRMEQKMGMFGIAHNPDSGSDSLIDGSGLGYSNVVAWRQSRNHRNQEYDMDLFGNMYFQVSEPSINLWYSTIGHSNHNLHLMPEENVGIGTKRPVAKLDVVANNDAPGLRVQQSAAGINVATFVNSGGATVVRVEDDCRVGICTDSPAATMHVEGTMRVLDSIDVGMTSAPMYKLDVNGDARLQSILNIQAPASKCILCFAHDANVLPNANTTRFIGFGASNDQLRYTVHSNIGAHAFFESSNELVRITGVGDVGIGTVAPAAKLHVAGNVVMSGDTFPTTNTLQNLGRSTNRWRNVYAAESVDIAGTACTVTPVGDMRVGTAGQEGTRSVIANSFYINTGLTTTCNIELCLGATDPVMFVERNIYGDTTNIYAPFLRSSTTGGISIGTNAPDALFHLVGQDQKPTVVIDHNNPAASNVMEVRTDNASFVTFTKSQRAGICTSVPQATVDVVGEMAVTQSNVLNNVATVSTASGQVRLIVDKTGAVGVGTSSPINAFHVNCAQTFAGGVSRFKENVYMEKDIDVQGNSYVHGDQTTDSDVRLKTDIRAISGALDKVRALTGYTFLKRNAETRSTGLLAQEVAEVLPEAVLTNPETGYLSVTYGNMMGLIIEAIKELDAKVDAIMRAVN